jgi:hypothetical protein
MSSGTPGGVIFDPDERSIYIEELPVGAKYSHVY